MTNGLKILAESLIIRKIQYMYIVINFINLFVFDDEIEMKNRSTIQTLTFVQTNLDHLYMKLNMKLVVVHAIIHCFGSKKFAPCKHFSWLPNWLLTFKTGTWKWHLAIFLAPTFWEPEQPLAKAIDIASFCDLVFDFGIAQTVWYFLFFIWLIKILSWEMLLWTMLNLVDIWKISSATVVFVLMSMKLNIKEWISNILVLSWP